MRALAAAALTAALSLGAAPANLTSPGASVANNPAGDGLDLQLESIEPAIVWPGDAVTVTVTVTNSSAAPIAEPLIEMWVDWRLLADRAALIDWVAAEAIAPEITHAYLALDDPLPAGESHTAEVSLNVDALGLSAGAFGPRKLSITLRDQARETPADALAQIRTFLIWDPTNEAEGNRQQVRVSLLAAVTGPPLPGTRASGALRDATAEDGRLSALLTVAQATATLADAPDSLAFAIDPALLATALAATDPQVVGWATALLEYGATTDVFALPAYDPDLAALARAELTEYSLGDILYTPVPPPWQTPEAWLGPLAWPGGDQEPDLRTLSAARSAGLTTAVIPFGMATTSGTASGLAQMHVGGGEITALIPDAPLTELLYLGTDATRLAEQETSRPELVQQVLAETAVIAAESGAEPHLLLALPRQWHPDADYLLPVLRALDTADWVRLAPLRELLDSEPTPAGHQSLPLAEPQVGELPPDAVRQLDAVRTSLDVVATIVDDPDELRERVTPGLTAPLAVAWREYPEERYRAVTTALAIARRYTEGLSLEVNHELAMISAEGSLPVTVRNDLPMDVHVLLDLHTTDTRLAVTERPVLTIPAESEARAAIPVRALASGNIMVEVRLENLHGDAVAPSAVMELRVRAAWETVGTAIIAALLAIFMVVGIIRTIRRGRSPRRTEGHPLTDPVIQSDASRSSLAHRGDDGDA